jgi:hypothetical protein
MRMVTWDEKSPSQAGGGIKKASRYHRCRSDWRS